MTDGLVVSDLHLFSRRSDGERLWKEIDAESESAEILVLNGDTFDFRWSNFTDEREAVEAALSWVSGLVGTKRWNQIHYIFGNHDCLREFTLGMKSLSEDHEALVCHDYQLRLGRNLFLHGDCANRRMDARALERFRNAWSEDRPRGPVSKALYDGVDAIGISMVFHQLYFPRERTVAKVVHHLDRVFPEWRSDIDHCFFGHTHRPFQNHQFEGVEFHNTGSGIRGMGFLPLPFSTKVGTT